MILLAYREEVGGGGGVHVSYILGVCVWEIKVSAWSMQVRYMVLSSPNLIGCMMHLGMVMDFTDLDEYCLWSTSKFVKQVIYWSITTAPNYFDLYGWRYYIYMFIYTHVYYRVYTELSSDTDPDFDCMVGLVQGRGGFWAVQSR